MTIAPSDPNRIYVVSGSPYGPDKGFYFSDDGGDSFHVGGRAYQTSSGYQWWFGRLWVDPLDKNHLFNADVNLRTSTDGGQTWTGGQRPALRSARDGLGSASRPGRVYLGNDGGMYRSDANGVRVLEPGRNGIERRPTSRGTSPTTSRSPSRTRSG